MHTERINVSYSRRNVYIEQADKQYEAQETSYRDFADKINQWIKTKELRSKSV